MAGRAGILGTSGNEGDGVPSRTTGGAKSGAMGGGFISTRKFSADLEAPCSAGGRQKKQAKAKRVILQPGIVPELWPPS